MKTLSSFNKTILLINLNNKIINDCIAIKVQDKKLNIKFGK